MRIKLCTLIFCFAFSSGQAIGLDLSFDLNRGKFSSGSLIGISDYYELDESHFSLSSWYFNISRSGYLSEDDSGDELTIWSQDASGGIGLMFLNNWTVDWSAYFSRTTETLYQQYGAQMNLAYSAGEKIPYSVGIGGGRSQIYQGIYFELFGNPIERDVEIDQSSVELTGSASFFEKLTIVLTGRTFLYSKTKQEFQDTFSNDFLNYYTSDLIASIASLPERQSSLQGIFRFNESWEGSLLLESTQLIVDNSRAYRNELLGTRFFETWSGSIGMSRNESTTASETIALFKFVIKI